MAAHAPGVPTAAVAGPLPVGETRRLASEVTPGEGVVTPTATAIRPRVPRASGAAAALPAVPAEDSEGVRLRIRHCVVPVEQSPRATTNAAATSLATNGGAPPHTLFKRLNLRGIAKNYGIRNVFAV